MNTASSMRWLVLALALPLLALGGCEKRESTVVTPTTSPTPSTTPAPMPPASAASR
jgi:hypothetical protein